MQRKKRSPIARFAMSSIAATLGQNARATEAPELGAVVISATRSERSLADVPAGVTVITREQIEQIPGQALDDVLRTVPGLDLPLMSSYNQHPTANFASMRGLGFANGTRTLVLLDGVPLNDPFFGYVQWNRVPMETVERVEVVRGGASSLYGNYAMGGVVNIITRAPKAKEGAFEAGAGTRDSYRTNVYGASPVGGAFTLGINANYFSTGGYNNVPPPFRAPLDVPVGSHAGNLQLTGDFRPDARTSGYVRAHYYDFNQHLGTPLSTNRQEAWDVSGGFNQRVGDNGKLEAAAFYQNSRFRTNNTNTPFGFARGFAEFVQNVHVTPVEDFGGSLQFSTSLTKSVSLLTVGADYHSIRGQDSAAIFDETGTQVRTDIGRGKQQFVGIFGQTGFTPTPELEILGSLRIDNWRNTDGFDGSPGGAGPTADRSKTSVNPRISVRYEVTPIVSLRGAAYKAFRAPTLDNLYRSFSVPGLVFQPNSQLNPETLTGAEIGVDFNVSRRLRSQVTLFRNYVKDLISFRPLTPAELALAGPGFFFGTRNVNVGRTRSTGIEAETTYSFNANWSATAAYAYTQAIVLENSVDPTTIGNQIGSVPRNKASLGLMYQQPRGLTAYVRGSYVQSHFADDAHTAALDSHFVVDAQASYALSRNLALFVSIQNLFNEQYIAGNFGLPSLGTPFQAFGGIRGRFQ